MPAQLTLRQLVQQACDQFAPADASSRYFTAALHHAQAFRRELVAGSARELKTALLQLAFDCTVPLPEDYAEYTMLGIQLSGWPTTRNLLYNGELSKIPAKLAAEAPADFLEPLTSYECEQARYGLLDEGYDGYCGYGYPGFAAEFRIDHDGGVIICNSRVPADALLVLEYYSFGAEAGEDIPIDPLAHSWAIQFILSRLHLQKQNVPMAREHERLASVEKSKYVNRTRNFSLGSALAARHVAAAQRWK